MHTHTAVIVWCGFWAAATASGADPAAPHAREADWQQDFNLSARTFISSGRNPYFILEPGYRTVLESDHEKLSITVLHETRDVDGVTTRVVEEREWKDGILVEVSSNYFALCAETQDAFYFGEDVVVYKGGQPIRNSDAWLAGVDGAQAGLIMPGQPRPGMRYYQERAPGVAMDRAEVVSIAQTLATPAGTFTNCLQTREGTALDPEEAEDKFYAPGIGLIQDEDLLLTRHGFMAGEAE